VLAIDPRNGSIFILFIIILKKFLSNIIGIYLIIPSVVFVNMPNPNKLNAIKNFVLYLVISFISDSNVSYKPLYISDKFIVIFSEILMLSISEL